MEPNRKQDLQKTGRQGLNSAAVDLPNYDRFTEAVDAVVARWETSTACSPAWTPPEWANNLKSIITRKIWDHQDSDAIRGNIILFLKKSGVQANIYDSEFPSFERLRGLGGRPFKGVRNDRNRSWLYGLNWKMLEQDALHHSEGIRGGRHNVHLLKISIEQSLQELAQKRWTTKYQEWIETISNNVKAYYNEYERQGRTPELLGALQACNDMVTRAKEVVEKVLWFYLPRTLDFERLSRLEHSFLEPLDKRQHANNAFHPQARRVTAQASTDPPGPAIVSNASDPGSATSMQAAQPRSIDTLDHQITLAMVGYHELHDEPGRTLARQRLNRLADLARHSHHSQTQIELVSWYLQYLSNFGWIGQPNPEILPISLDQLQRLRHALECTSQYGR